MGWKLKSGLGKKAVYQMIIDHNTSGVDLPPVGKCDFSRSKRSYWFNFDFKDSRYECYFCVWGGEARFLITKRQLDAEDCVHETPIQSCLVPFDYLLEHEMLREVA